MFIIQTEAAYDTEGPKLIYSDSFEMYHKKGLLAFGFNWFRALPVESLTEDWEAAFEKRRLASGAFN